MNRSYHIAISNLCQALHFHRHFGIPLDGLSPERNASRAETTARTVVAYARDAGKYLALAGQPVNALDAKYPEACAVPSILAAMRAAYSEMADVLARAEAEL